MLKVTKFGGSSLCDSAGFARVREIVLADPARRVVVVSAAGKRHAADHKITDLLYLCHAHLQYEVSCWDLWRRVADRYREIRDGCALTLPIEAELEAIYAAMDRRTPRDWIVSRGEYLSARLMADLLGFDFVDAKDWLLFDAAGRVRPAASYAALGSLADGRKIVTPGFYGALPDGQIHTLPRGGSDVTGALAAAALLWGMRLRGSLPAFLGSWALTVLSTLSVGLLVVGVFPLTQGITMMKHAFLGIGPGSILPPICVMLALTALCTLLSLRFFRWE